MNSDQPSLPLLPPASPPPTFVQLVESLLFVASEPVSLSQLASALECSETTAAAAVEELQARCRERGVRVQRHHEYVQLVSAPEAAKAIGRFLGLAVSPRLSAASLEVLAIIAYRQPLTRAQIEAIRGVDCSGPLRALLARDLIGEAGRGASAGRPILYATTATFLQQFGLTSLADLPPMDLPSSG